MGKTIVVSIILSLYLYSLALFSNTKGEIVAYSISKLPGSTSWQVTSTSNLFNFDLFGGGSSKIPRSKIVFKSSAFSKPVKEAFENDLISKGWEKRIQKPYSYSKEAYTVFTKEFNGTSYQASMHYEPSITNAREAGSTVGEITISQIE